MSTKNPRSQRECFIWIQFGLRLLGLGLCSAAFIVMRNSNQSIGYFEARYTYSSAFKFLAVVDIVVCVYSLLSLLFVLWLSCFFKLLPSFYFTLFLHDLALSLLMLAGCAGGTAIGYVGRYGQKQSGWSPICKVPMTKIDFTPFCDKISISITLSYITLFCYLILTVSTVYKIKSHYAGINKSASAT